MNLKRKKDMENKRRDGMIEGKRRNHERRFSIFFPLPNIMWVGGSADTDGRFCALVVFGLYIQTSETTLDKESSGERPAAAAAATTTKKPSAQFCTHHCLFHYFRFPSNSTEQKFLMPSPSTTTRRQKMYTKKGRLASGQKWNEIYTDEDSISTGNRWRLDFRTMSSYKRLTQTIHSKDQLI